MKKREKLARAATRLFARIGIDFGEVSRFALVGIANTVLAYLVYAFFVFVGVPYYIALIFDYAFAIVFSVFANRQFTFKSRTPVRPRIFIRMAGSYGLLFLLNEGMLKVLVDFAGFSAYSGQAIATVAVALTSYVMQKYVVFHAVKKD